MLEDLVMTIESLKKRIRDHREDIQNYESRTRVTLIDPVLCVLGWDVSNPGIVTIEPKGPDGWADYALLGNNGRTIVIFVEAKKLSDRDAPISQTVGYAVTENIQNNANVRYCASTNGDTWELYDIIAQKSVMKTSIFSEDAAKCAFKLLGLWRGSMADGAYDIAIEPVAPTVTIPVEPPTPTPTPTPTPGEWVALNEGFDPNGKPAPKSLRLPNGQEININSWRALIIQTATWLHSVGKLTKENCQILSWETAKSAANRYILSNDGKHVDGTEFWHPYPIADNLILEIHLSSREVVRRTTRLLEKCDQDPSQILLRLT